MTETQDMLAELEIDRDPAVPAAASPEVLALALVRHGLEILHREGIYETLPDEARTAFGDALFLTTKTSLDDLLQHHRRLVRLVDLLVPLHSQALDAVKALDPSAHRTLSEDARQRVRAIAKAEGR